MKRSQVGVIAFVLGMVAVVSVLSTVFNSTGMRLDVSLISAARIKRGMTEAQVEKIVGGPPGDYTSGPVETVGTDGMREIIGSYAAIRVWTTDNGEIQVAFEDPPHYSLLSDPLYLFKYGRTPKVCWSFFIEKRRITE